MSALMRVDRRLWASLSVALVLVFLGQRHNIEAAAGQVYWCDVAAQKIQRANVDGTGIEDVILTGNANTPQGLALDNTSGKLYWSQEGPDGGIRRANFDGSGQETLVNDAADTSAIALDGLNGTLYWVGWTQAGIWRANLDGTAVEKLSDYPLVSSGGLAIDAAAGKLYFSVWAWDGGWVGRANLDGSGVEPLVTDLGGPSGMALDLARGEMYWVSRRYGTIQRAKLDGSNLETPVTGLGTPGTIAIDSSTQKIYWTDFGTGKVQRASVDGTGIEDVVTGLLLPSAIALAETSVTIVAIDIKPGSFPNSINLSSSGVVPVAVLSSATFDATRIDAGTLALAGARVRVIGNGRKYSCRGEDVNRDGFPDLVCQVVTAGLVLQPGDTTAVLTAATYEGQSVRGEDSVRIVR